MTFLLIILTAIVVWTGWSYNKIVCQRNLVKEYFGRIDIHLGYRHNLVPILCHTVKTYAKNEKELFERIESAKNNCINAYLVKDKMVAENKLSDALKTLFSLAEAYPELKTNFNFVDLQRQMCQIEERIQSAKRLYNVGVRNFNDLIVIVPNKFIAKFFGFKEANLFEIESSCSPSK